jgi:predicted Rossmann-fold nucleotide-binding protein
MTRVIRQFSKIGGNICGGGGDGVMMYLYVHAQHPKKYKTL